MINILSLLLASSLLYSSNVAAQLIPRVTNAPAPTVCQQHCPSLIGLSIKTESVSGSGISCGYSDRYGDSHTHCSYHPTTGCLDSGSSSSKCLAYCCADDYTFYTGSNGCVPKAQCAAGQYRNANNACVSCPSGTTSNAGSSTCSACTAGTYSGRGASSCSQCPANTYSGPGASSCRSCPDGHTCRAGSTESSHCTPSCAAGSYLQNGACNNCPSGTYSSSPNSASCLQCSANTFSGAGATSCTQCPAGGSALPGSSSCSCPAGSIGSNGQCSPCPGGSVPSSGGNSCTTCPRNTFSNGNNCSPCPAGSTSNPGSTSCGPQPVQCSAGSFFSNGACATCAAGTFSSSSGSTSCTACDANTFSGPGAASCTPCPAGQASDAGSASCTTPDCPAGSFSDDGGCTLCPAGTISNPGSASCTPCPGGSVPAANGQTCTTCPRNTFSNGDNCSPCPAGSTSNPGSASCGPQPSRRATIQKVLTTCPQDHKLCPIMAGMAQTECVDTSNSLESCGGCVGVGTELEGQDCSSIPHVADVSCVRGKCLVQKCRGDFEVSSTKNSCVERTKSRSAKRAHEGRRYF